ncbi:Gfo/Idh/MocA family protein [Leifsonia sp. Root112D2]|uniref:Gfo/Idh/MocA family protein n=1 Tax=Leifsonia sp. Root112D2 TaxID=1736426 RepID=UPI0006F2B5E7|nr:Gfo/Idh/MocA family oxidoreductase [Leifsonia sp. Root112D2]KQV07377.1 oxidoreductase [Leifsonia sp. Root112D2]
MSHSSSHDPVRIGIVGSGAMGRLHAEYIAQEPQTELVAVADPVNGAVAESYGVRQFADHHELIAWGELDAVIVSSPNSVHVVTALDLLEAGIPTLLEKPVATSFAEAQQLVAATRDHATPILVGHHRRHHPAVHAAHELISSGGLGRIVAVNGMWMTRKTDAYFELEWHRKPGAGVMLINLVHDLDLLRHLCGEIVSVQARTSNSARGNEVEDTASVIVEFSDGALGTFVVSDAVVAPWGWDQTTQDDPSYPFNPDVSAFFIAGTEGSLAFPEMAHYFHTGVSDWNHPLSRSFEPHLAGNSYVSQLRHFVDVVRGEAQPLVTVADAAQTLAVIETAHEAARTGSSTRVPTLDAPTS